MYKGERVHENWFSLGGYADINNRNFKSLLWANKLDSVWRIANDWFKWAPRLFIPDEALFPQAKGLQRKNVWSAVTRKGGIKRRPETFYFTLIIYFRSFGGMFRTKTNCMIRKTWGTTKHPERLIDHLAIDVFLYHSILTAA